MPRKTLTRLLSLVSFAALAGCQTTDKCPDISGLYADEEYQLHGIFDPDLRNEALAVTDHLDLRATEDRLVATFLDSWTHAAVKIELERNVDFVCKENRIRLVKERRYVFRPSWVGWSDYATDTFWLSRSPEGRLVVTTDTWVSFREQYRHEATWSPVAQLPVHPSSIETHVPAPADFDAFLRRDILAYAKSAISPDVSKVNIKLLKDAPTPMGTKGNPRYYGWITAYAGSRLIEQGAAEIAAVERKRFEVRDYLSRADLQSADDARLNNVFLSSCIVSTVRALANAEQSRSCKQ